MVAARGTARLGHDSLRSLNRAHSGRQLEGAAHTSGSLRSLDDTRFDGMGCMAVRRARAVQQLRR